MFAKCLRLTLIIITVLIARTAVAETSLYEIRKANHLLYLGGTIHLLRDSDFPLPTEFEAAYGATQVLVLESDLKEAESPEFGQKLMAAMMYTDGSNLSSVLSPKVWKDLQDYAAANQIQIQQMIGFKPVLVSLILTMAEGKRLGLSAGVDAYFDKKARSENKKLIALESSDEVIKSLTSIDPGDSDELISSTLRDLHKMGSLIGEMVDYWRTGNLAKLDSALGADMKREAPDVYQALVVNRNNLWLPKIEALLTTPEQELVLVGSLHLTGEQGLLAQLSKRGYSVKPARAFAAVDAAH